MEEEEAEQMDGFSELVIADQFGSKKAAVVAPVEAATEQTAAGLQGDWFATESEKDDMSDAEGEGDTTVKCTRISSC